VKDVTSTEYLGEVHNPLIIVYALRP